MDKLLWTIGLALALLVLWMVWEMVGDLVSGQERLERAARQREDQRALRSAHDDSLLQVFDRYPPEPGSGLIASEEFTEAVIGRLRSSSYDEMARNWRRGAPTVTWSKEKPPGG